MLRPAIWCCLLQPLWFHLTARPPVVPRLSVTKPTSAFVGTMPRNKKRERSSGAAVEQQQQQQQQQNPEPPLVPTPPGAQDELAFVRGRLQEAESDYAIVSRDLAILKREGRAAHKKRSQLRMMERSSMIRMGLDVSSLPRDWSYEPSPASSDPEEEDKEETPRPGGGDIPRLGA